MDSDNYIDRLDVDLKLQSTYKPYEAQEAADSIVDGHILPAVESVLEEMGRNADVSIPKIEIDVGRVRLQDLRYVIESLFRSALERQMAFSASSTAETLREFAGTGMIPWEEGGVPFNPHRYLEEMVERDVDTAMTLISGFSEKELVGLLMAVPSTSAGKADGKGRRVLDGILDRLMRISPETAAVIRGRQLLWRDYLGLPGGDASAPVSDAAVSASAFSATDAAGFRYVEIDLRDIPEGVSVDVSDFIDAPGPDAPEFIMTPGPPVKYYRKEAAPVPAYRYVEIALKDIPEGAPVETMDLPDAPGPDAPEFILEFGSSVKYYRKVAAGEAVLFPRMESPESIQGQEVSFRTEVSAEASAEASADAADEALAEARREQRNDVPLEREEIAPQEREEVSQEREKVLEERAEALLKQTKAHQGRQPVRQDIPDVSSEVSMDKESASVPLAEVSAEERPSGETGETSFEEVDKPSFEEAGSPREDHPVFRYVEIDRRDIPEGASIEVSEDVGTPGPGDPEYVMTVDTPVRFFRKTVIGKDEPSASGRISLPRTPGTTARVRVGEGVVDKSLTEEGPVSPEPAEPGPDPGPKRGLEPSPERSPSPETDVWEVRDFESEWTKERVPVSDAGLVLLHPFLLLLMKNLGLTKGGKFISPLARVRAVHLLRDLTGSPEPHFSHNLILEKILCGLPPGFALPSEWEPDENEKEETEALLKAVCGYWRPLSGSSTKALCDGFILRPGTVERFEDTWIVKVEGRTIDILMDELPWELSLVHLPWLDNPVSVEWQRE